MSNLKPKSILREPIAVIGIGCRFPGGIHSLDSLWQALLNGIDAISEIPIERWDADFLYDQDIARRGTINSRRGGFLKDIDQFDAEFFNFFPAEAKQLDPQQRLLLEVSYEAFEDAGETLERLKGSRTGVFIGTFVYDYHTLGMEGHARDRINAHSAMGSGMASLANRLSYTFDFKGPSLMLDTYCSSSLVALHLACRSIWNGDAEMAIAGGVNAILKPEFSIALSKAGFLSPDGNCKAFDAAANGYVRSEGVGVVFLKPLSMAIRDGDQIYTLIRGSAINQNGYVPEGMTVPSIAAQVDMLQRAYADAGVNPADVAYVEAHGPGTVVGDPIEINGLGAVLGKKHSEDKPLWVGSIKTNLGHLEGASGIAGFIKAALVSQHAIAPPNLHFNEPNPKIDFKALHIAIPTQATTLAKPDAAMITAVNSFGAGGTNVHVVLERYLNASNFSTEKSKTTTQPPANEAQEQIPRLFTLSARNQTALVALAQRYVDWLGTTDARLSDIAWSQLKRRSRHPHQVFMMAHNRGELVEQMKRIAKSEQPPSIAFYTTTPPKKPQLVFVFSGQGGQWAGMGLSLMASEPAFQRTIHDIDALFKPLAGWSIIEEIQRPEAESRLNECTIVQPTTMAIQIALAALYQHYGVKPDAIVGHSIGEIAAAWAAGAIDLPTAVAVIYHRARIQDKASGQGKMLAAAIDKEQAEQLLFGIEQQVCIATLNGPNMLTLAGDEAMLNDIAAQLEAQGIFHRFVKVQVPYHSHYMEPLRDELLNTLAPYQGHACHTPLYSTVSAQRESGTHINAEYWYYNVRKPVLFSDTVSRLLDDGYTTFIEIAPHPVLSTDIRDTITQKKSTAIVAGAMNRKLPDIQPFWLALGAWLAHGGDVDMQALLCDDAPQYVKLPHYPWQHKRYWYEGADEIRQRSGNGYRHPFLERRIQGSAHGLLDIWEVRIDSKTHPYLKDHMVDGAIVLPATAHIELANAVAQHMRAGSDVSLTDVRFNIALVIPETETDTFQVRLEVNYADNHYVISSGRNKHSEQTTWQRHSSGYFDFGAQANETLPPSVPNLQDILAHFAEIPTKDVEKFYRVRRNAGLNYGQTFQCIRHLQLQDHRVLAKLHLDDSLLHESQFLRIHPTLLDAAIHTAFAYIHATEEPERHYLPEFVKRITWYAQPTQDVWSYTEITNFDDKTLVGDGYVYNPDGTLVMHSEQLSCRHVPSAVAQKNDIYQGLYEEHWIKQAPAPPGQRYENQLRYAVIIGQHPLINIPLQIALRERNADITIVELPLSSQPILQPKIPLDSRCQIIYVAPTELEPQDNDLSGDALENVLLTAITPLLHVLQTITKQQGVPRFALLTCGAQRVKHEAFQDNGCAVGVQAVLQNMVRVANNEYPNVIYQSIDLSSKPCADDIKQLCDELFSHSISHDESEIALRDSNRFLKQLIALDAADVEKQQLMTLNANSDSWRIEIAGQQENRIGFRHVPETHTETHEVLIAVEAIGLSHYDLQRLLPSYEDSQLGFQVAGTVLNAGAAVTRFKSGDSVWAFSGGKGCTSRLCVNEDSVDHRPAHLSSHNAAAVPVPYGTALYALRYLARIQPEASVLLRGLGRTLSMAMVHVATSLGANVTVISDNPSDTTVFEAMNVRAVISDHNMNEWVQTSALHIFDVVISASSGSQAALNLSCLKAFGQFITLAKLDYAFSNQLANGKYTDTISINTLNMEQVLTNTAMQCQLLAYLKEFFAEPVLPSLEITTFPVSSIAEAIKDAAQRSRQGSPVLLTQNDSLVVMPSRQLCLAPEKAYLITGGTSGLGLRLADWLTSRGARHLVLISRNGCKQGSDKERINTIQARGVRVDIIQADVADAKAVNAIFIELQAQSISVGGIIHAAGVMDDASLANMTPDRFRYTLRPKAIGAWNLHRACQQTSLDFLLFISSISSQLGMVGTSNYASSNHFMEALTEYRRANGLLATTVALGVLGDYAGLSKATDENQHMLDLLEGMGFQRMRLNDVLNKIELTLLQQVPNRLAAKVNWSRYITNHPHLAKELRYGAVMHQSQTQSEQRMTGNLSDRLTALPREDAVRCLAEQLAGALAKLLDMNVEEISLNDSFDRFGLDSIMLVQFSIWVQRETTVDLPLMWLLRGPSIVELSQDILQRMTASQSGDAEQNVEQALNIFSGNEQIEPIGRWLLRSQGRAEAPLRILCFHSIGVGASLFTHFLMNPPELAEVIAVQTPGRENRLGEALIEKIDILIDHLYPQILPLLDKPLVFWGHSFGGIIAFEVMRRLRAQHKPLPVHFMITGTAAPDYLRVWQRRDVLLRVAVEDNTPEYLLSLSRYLDNPSFVMSILPLMRRDMPLLMSYRYQAEKAFPVPITGFSARQDDIVYRDEMEPWRQQTTAAFELLEVDGDHWFLLRHKTLIEAKLNEITRTYVDAKRE